jgi:hypothetical protein
MTTFSGKNWNTLRVLPTSAGMWTSVYRPGDAGETVAILAPDGKRHSVHTPALADWSLAAEDGLLTVYYLRIVGDGHDFVRVPTAIPCGQLVGQMLSGGVGLTGPVGAQGPQGEQGEQGPAGPAGEDAVALTADDIDRIAERFYTYPPAPDHFGLPEYVRYGTRFQEMIAVMVHQALAQHIIMATDEGAANLVANGYQPKITT